MSTVGENRAGLYSFFTMQRTKKDWGFDRRSIDAAVRPQDDFYRYVNGQWLVKNKIPNAESRWGSFIMLRYDTEKKLKKIINELLHERPRRSFIKGSVEQLVADMYRSATDLKTRRKIGTGPIEPFRKMIAKITTRQALLDLLPFLHRYGVDVFFGAAVDQDAKRSQSHILYLFQSGLGMPDRDYYLSDKPEPTRVREAYIAHATRLLALFGIEKSVATQKVTAVMRIETRLAKASMNKVDLRDPHKTYHKKTLRALAAHTPGLRWRAYLEKLGAGSPTSLILCQPDFFREVWKILNEAPLADLKAYLEWHLLSESASLLSEPFVRENFRYAQALSGQKKMRPLWRRGLGAVNGIVGEALGQLYVRKHFTSEAKRMMNGLVDDLFAAYAERIKKLDWMSPATKRKALAKLRRMTRKIGYPSRWKGYRGLDIRPDDYAGNILRSELFEHRRAMRKLGKPVDRTEWFMSPQTVNAYFNPGLNEIVFPAAILQKPFFDPAADAAVNYGAIGYTIGHEITHGFDDQGSKFDGKGNLKGWWTKSDRVRFDRKASVIARQYDGYEVAPGMKVNGKLTLGENIADLGGISIAFDAYTKHLEKAGRKDLGGFTPEQRFFLGCAQGERELARPEILKTIVMTDPHSPAEFRVNGPLSNLPEFYEAFGLKKGDKLYRELGKRARIW